MGVKGQRSLGVTGLQKIKVAAVTAEKKISDIKEPVTASQLTGQPVQH